MSKTIINEIEVNGVTYVAKGAPSALAVLDDYCIVRTYSAGVFVGNLADWGKTKIGTVKNARRIFYWSGAASLSQLALEGVKNPESCKFAMEVPEVHLTEIIEVLPCTVAAYRNIQAVPVWKK